MGKIRILTAILLLAAVPLGLSRLSQLQTASTPILPAAALVLPSSPPDIPPPEPAIQPASVTVECPAATVQAPVANVASDPTIIKSEDGRCILAIAGIIARGNPAAANSFLGRPGAGENDELTIGDALKLMAALKAQGCE